jgi:hypothetical protein
MQQQPAHNTSTERVDELNRRLAQLTVEVTRLNQALHRRKRQKRKPRRVSSLPFPFSMLELLIQWGLDSLERLVRLAVENLIR